VTNVGTQLAGAHRIGYYVSTAATAAGLPRLADGRIDTANTTTYARLLTSNGAPAVVNRPALASQNSESVDALPLLIPSDVPRPNPDGTGVVYLYAYVDDLRSVSEIDENNNIIGSGAITVLPSQSSATALGFLGLQTPCSGFTCTKSGSLPIAWQFTQGGTPIDSATSLPRLKWWTGCPTDPAAVAALIATPPIRTSSPNPADITTGNSGFQYFPDTGGSRAQFTWQFNFGQTGLPVGCYTMYLEIPSTGQVLGSTNPALQPFGPFRITLQ
jgi:hypothetical protein